MTSNAPSALPTLELTFEKSTCNYEMVYQVPTVVKRQRQNPNLAVQRHGVDAGKRSRGRMPGELSLSTWWELTLAAGGNVYVAEK